MQECKVFHSPGNSCCTKCMAHAKQTMSSSGKVDCDASSATPPGCLSERWISQLLCISLHEWPVHAVFYLLTHQHRYAVLSGFHICTCRATKNVMGKFSKYVRLQQYRNLGEWVCVDRGMEQCRQTKSVHFFFVLCLHCSIQWGTLQVGLTASVHAGWFILTCHWVFKGELL